MGIKVGVDVIVVGYDGSEGSERALERSAELAAALAARLVLVSVERSSREPVTGPVLEPGTMFVPGSAGGAVPVGQPEPEPGPEPEELARRLLEQAGMRLAGRGVEVDYVAEVGPAAERLLEVAQQRGADLLVVGSREHGLLERLLARPVDEAVARHADRDVLLVH